MYFEDVRNRDHQRRIAFFLSFFRSLNEQRFRAQLESIHVVRISVGSLSTFLFDSSAHWHVLLTQQFRSKSNSGTDATSMASVRLVPSILHDLFDRRLLVIATAAPRRFRINPRIQGSDASNKLTAILVMKLEEIVPPENPEIR